MYYLRESLLIKMKFYLRNIANDLEAYPVDFLLNSGKKTRFSF